MKQKNLLALIASLIIVGAMFVLFVIAIEPEKALALMFFWAISATILFLLTLATTELRLGNIIPIMLIIVGVVLVSASFGNMMFHYQNLPEFLAYNLNLSGLIVGVLVIVNAVCILHIHRPENFFKRRNNLLDENLEEI